jgi:hypothetical protein
MPKKQKKILRSLSVEEQYSLVKAAFDIADGSFDGDQAETMFCAILEQCSEETLVTWRGIDNRVFGSDRINKLVALIALSRLGPREIYYVMRQAIGEEDWKGDKKNGFTSWRESLVALLSSNKDIPKTELFSKEKD